MTSQKPLAAILYEDSSILVLDKPSGVPSAPLRPGEAGTAVSAALAHLPELARLAEGGLLHRLDTGTSGALAFGKTDADIARIRALWNTPRVRKVYRAIVTPSSKRAPMEPPLTIDRPIGHSAKSSKKMIVLPSQSKIRGKPQPALTRVLRATPVSAGLDLEIEIETGVMHQIRCHLSALGHPICGDLVYGGAPSERLWLHAWKLVLPKEDGRSLTVEAPLPSGWPK